MNPLIPSAEEIARMSVIDIEKRWDAFLKSRPSRADTAAFIANQNAAIPDLQKVISPDTVASSAAMTDYRIIRDGVSNKTSKGLLHPEADRVAKEPAPIALPFSEASGSKGQAFVKHPELPNLERHVSWLSLFTTARGPLVILLLAAAALLIPAQMADMLDAVSSDIWARISFHLSLALLSISAWYWSRALLSARFDITDDRAGREELIQRDARVDPFAFDVVPRSIFGLAVAIGLGVIIKSRSWYDLLFLGVWAIPFALFVVYRLDWKSQITGLRGRSQNDVTDPQAAAKTARVHEWLRNLSRRFFLVLRRAPYSDSFSFWPALTLFIIAFAGFIFGAVESFVVWGAEHQSLPAVIARSFPGPSAALLAMSLMIAPFAVLTFLADGLDLSFTFRGRLTGFRRPPVMVPLLAWIMAMPYFVSLHTVRMTEGAPAVRQTLSQVLAAWTKACGRDGREVRPVIVAISGGASRAGVWGARVLDEVERVAGDGGGSAAIFAVSSVSGGSLGAAAYFALLANMAPEERCAREARQTQLAALGNPKLGQDALGPVLAGALFVDIPRAIFAPFAAAIRSITNVQPRGGDRAEAIERSFEDLWGRIDPTPAAVPHMTFSSPYLSLFYEGAGLKPGMPLWIANGTDLRTGARLLTIPFQPEKGWAFLGAADVHSALAADVPVSTAINNTARFPYLEPSGELLGKGPADQPHGARIIDGGYFENEGLETALDLADWIEMQRAQGAVIGRPIIVQATADGAADFDANDILRCSSAMDAPSMVKGDSLPLEVLAPLIGLYSTRGGHSGVVLREARNRYCGGETDSFFHFILPGILQQDGKTRINVPLNWILSEATHKGIWDAMDDTASGNPEERSQMRNVFAQPPKMSRPSP